LLDSLEDLADSANALLQGRGYPMHAVSEYRHFVGDGARTLIQRILPEALRNDAGLVQACLDQYVREYEVRWDQKTRPYDGIPELLTELALRGIALAVLSNKPHHFTEKCIQTLCPAPPGSEWAVIVGFQEGLPLKPDPTGVLNILRTLQIAPSETIYFGDTSTDMKTAVAAGVYPIGALWGFRSREELEQSGAKLLLAQPCDLFPRLPRTNSHWK
jgi:phosphoglycolate phosphatase